MPSSDDLERRKEDSPITPEDRDEVNNESTKKLKEISRQLMEFRLPGDIYITFTHGLDEYDIEFIQNIESRIDSALVGVGFARTETSKSSDSVRFVYRQFAKGL